MKNKFYKKAFLITLLVLGSLQLLSAQTIIDTDTEWTTDQILTQSVIVQEGAKLIIHPGVVVSFLFVDLNNDQIGDLSLTVNGEIIIRGKPENHVVFKPYESTDNKSYWSGININSNIVNDSCKFFEIQNAHVGLNINSVVVINGLKITSPMVTGLNIDINSTNESYINNLFIKKSDSIGVSINSSNLTLAWADIDSCNHIGLSAIGQGVINLENSIISNSSGAGIFIQNSDINIQNSIVNNCKNFGLVLNECISNVDHSEINNNRLGGTLIAGGSNVQIESTTISNNGGSGIEITDWTCDIDLKTFNNNIDPVVKVNNSNIINNSTSEVKIKQPEISYLWPGFASAARGIDSQTLHTWTTGIGVPFGWISRIRFRAGFGAHYVVDSNTGITLGSLSISQSYTGSKQMILDKNSCDRYKLQYYNPYGVRLYCYIDYDTLEFCLGGYEVSNSAGDNLGSYNFQNNYWGVVSGVDGLVRDAALITTDYSAWNVSEYTDAYPSISSAKMLSLSEPSSGSSVETYTNIELLWYTEGFIGSVNIYESHDLGASWSILRENVTNTGSYAFLNTYDVNSSIYFKIEDSNDDQINSQTGPIYITENTTPVLSTNNDTLSFITIDIDTFYVYNSGGGELSWDASVSNDWISVVPLNATTTDSSQVIVTVKKSGISAGNYIGSISLTSNGGNKTIIVNMSVPSPVLVTSVSLLEYGLDTDEKTVILSNSGGESINWSISSSQSWISFVPSSGSFIEKDTVNILVNRDGLSTGIYNGSAIITSNGGNKQLDISMEVPEPPILTVDSDTLDFGTHDINLVFTIQNSGEGQLNWTINTPVENWLFLSPQSGTNMLDIDTVWVCIDRALIYAGINEASITISSNCGTSLVNIIVDIIPVISADISSIDFDSTKNILPIKISNNGDGILSFSASSMNEWISVSPDTGSVSTGKDSTVWCSIDRSLLYSGSHNGVLSIKSDGGNINIDVHVKIIPELNISVSTIDFGKIDNEKKIVISNQGDGILVWNILNEASWLDFSKINGETLFNINDTVDVILNRDSIPDPGIYQSYAYIVSGDERDSVLVTAETEKFIKIVAPSSSEGLLSISEFYLQWQCPGISGNLKLEYRTSQNESWKFISEVPTNSVKYTWNVPNDPSDSCQIKITSMSDTTIYDISYGFFKIFGLKVNYPNGGESFEVGEQIPLNWFKQIDENNPISQIKISYSINNGSSWDVLAASYNYTWAVNWTVRNTPSEQCLLKIEDINEPNRFDISDSTWSIIIPSDLLSDSKTLPGEYYLSQNYPNPFNPTTTIIYGLPKISHVDIRIYDLLGREVTTLVNDNQEAKHYKVIWDAKDRSGNDVPGGMYLYRIVAKSGDRTFIKTKKLLLMR